MRISSLWHVSWTTYNRILDKDPCLVGEINEIYNPPYTHLAHPPTKASLSRLVIRDDDSLMLPISRSLWRITPPHTYQFRQGQVQHSSGTASPWKLVEDTRTDLGLVISVARWVTSRVIAHAARAKGIIMHLADEVIFRVVEGLEDMVEEGVTTSSPEEIFSLHQGRTRRNR
jgi:hypothetical protein